MPRDRPASERPEGVITRKDLVTPPHRPGDHYEGRPISDPGAIAAVVNEGRARGLPDDTAISLVAERRIVISDLDALRLGRFTAALDELAAAATPRLGLWPATLAYLDLLAPEPTNPAVAGDPLPRHIGMPARLTDRLLAEWPPSEPLRHEELGLALAWERASIFDGLTQGEWALRATLVLIGGGPPSK